MSSIANSHQRSPQPHIALFPSAGMGHLVPFLRLAAMLASHNCMVTFIAAQPPVSAAESNELSDFLASYPEIQRLDFQIPPYKTSAIQDPFFNQFEAISRSAYLLHPLLASLSPSLSAIFRDFTFTKGITSVANDLSIPFYVVSTTSARFFSLMACLPNLTFGSDPSFRDTGEDNDAIKLPGLASVPLSSVPPPFFNPNDFFCAHIRSNAQFLHKAQGVVMNTFHWFESETIAAVNEGIILPHIPRFFPVGPYDFHEVTKGPCSQWLDNQPDESVIYVSFGSRTALSKEQIRELGYGLERSGCRFLWVLKTTKVDKDDKEDLEDLLGDSFLQRIKDKGLVLKGWVNQQQILAHPAVGGFVSHCGWNSVIEAARRGVPIIAWPQNGDQKLNAEVVEKAGLGIWERHWGWLGQNLVREKEIGEKIINFMQNQTLKARAKIVMQEARQAVEIDGSSRTQLREVIELLELKKGS